MAKERAPGRGGKAGVGIAYPGTRLIYDYLDPGARIGNRVPKENSKEYYFLEFAHFFDLLML